MKRIVLALILLLTLATPPALAAPRSAPDAPDAAILLSTSYSQNFDTLANTGTANTWTDDSTLSGWYSTRTTYRADTGASNTGALYSYGAASATERALGSVASGSTGTIYYGVRLVNNTADAVATLSVSYAGEEWRMGGNATPQKLTFYYQVGATMTSLTTGTWTTVSALNFTGPIASATPSSGTALDGNAAANRVALSYVLPVVIPAGQEIMLRWEDINDAGNDHGLAIDDLSISASFSANAPIVPTCPALLYTVSGQATSGAISAVDSDGTAMSAAITGGGATGISVDGVIPASGSGGTLNGTLNIGAATPPGDYSVVITFSNSDTAPQTATCTVPVKVYDPVCTAASVTPISQVQGNAASSPQVGQTVAILGTVVGDFQGASALNGFYVQDSGDGDPLTSDGIFVYGPGALDVSVGSGVVATGTVSEYNGITEISLTSLTPCDAPFAIAATPVTLPEAANNDLERYEGMLVTFPQALTVDQNYFQGRYGEVTLSSDGRMYNPTNGNGLGDTVDLNARRMIVLDDGLSTQNPSPIPYIGADNTMRAGDTVTSLTGVMDYGLITSDGVTRDYKIQPTAPVSFTRVNNRTAAPDPVGGNLKVASANVLNYFTTLTTSGAVCGPSRNMDCRGANSAAELARQRTKILAELEAINADVVGLMEIENTDDTAVADLVNGLNADLGAGTYQYVVEPAPGSDAIKVAMLYKPGVVTPVGAALNYQVSDPTYGPELFDRPPLAQTFSLNANGEMFSVVVNHFKSKGSCPASGPDADPTQGCWNAKRIVQANALLGFIATLQAADPDVLVIGDLNAYGAEDPIKALVAGGLVNEVAARVPAATRYTYIFDGLSGYLDQGLATPSLDLQVSGVTLWHNNADEPSVIDYNTEFKPQDLYTPTPYRASDHDPVVIGINLLPALDRAIAGYAFLDTNSNGSRQNDEQAGLVSVVLTLSQNGVQVSTTQSTGPSGWYAFGEMAPGSYCLDIAVPLGYMATSATQVCFDKLDGQPAVINFGLQPLPAATIGDLVWLDLNANGVQDAGEPGIAGVTLALWSAAGDAPGSVIAEATTDAGGLYGFAGLAPGSYFVEVTDTAGILAGLNLTVGPQSKPSPFGPISVSYGDAYREADFGYAFVCAASSGALSGIVWQDTNGDGAQTGDEPGIAGAQVCAEPMSHLAIRCATTNTAGVYRVCLPRGTYLIVPGGVPEGMTPTTADFKLPWVVKPGGQYTGVNFGFGAAQP